MITGNVNDRTDESIIEDLNIHANVIALLKHIDGTFEVYTTHNLITDDGADYYAELASIGRALSGTPTNAFDSAILGNSATPGTPAVTDNFSDFVQGSLLLTTEKVTSAAEINNTDTDNTGKGAFIFTWKFIWSGGDFDTESVNNVTSGIITTPSPTGTDPILNHWLFSPTFEKLSTSTLTLWVNHTFADNTP